MSGSAFLQTSAKGVEPDSFSFIPKMLTPESDAALEEWDRFTSRIRERLENGKRVYGDGSFERPLASLAEEIRQELEDVGGWAFITWIRVNRLEAQLAAMKGERL